MTTREEYSEDELLCAAIARAISRENPGFISYLIESLRELSLLDPKLSPQEKQLIDELRRSRS